MANYKKSKVASDLNIGISNIEKTLAKKGIAVDSGPNARISEEVYEILLQEFAPDRLQSKRNQDLLEERRREKEEKKAPKEADKQPPVASPSLPGLKILGSIDDLKAPKKEEKPAPAADDVKPAKAVKPAEKPKADAEEGKPAETKEKPAATAPEAATPAAAAPAKKEDKPVEKAGKIAKSTPDKAPEVVENKPVEDKAESKPEEKKEANDAAPEKKEAPTRTVSLPGVKVLGKIDIANLHTDVRPKPKTKEEKRRERANRKRIGGNTKVDINREAAQQQAAAQQAEASRQNKKQSDGRREKGSRKERSRREKRPEISEQDVDRQFRDTIAQISNKAQNKGAKFRKEKREANAEREQEKAQMQAAESKVLKLTEFVTANDLAAMMGVSVTEVIKSCMKLGKMVSINQRLEADIIELIADDFGFSTEFVSEEVVNAIAQDEDKEEDLVSRPPIVTVMGHVDHGKTKLLDYIRNANVVAGEAGGITQHIGAYNVKLDDGRHITFLDTPGHEAFTAMRARGAKVTDICIIIVSAAESVMPQTVEAINHASAAGVPIVFAINKIDLPQANPEKIKEELANMNYLVEDWGGKYQSQDISAKAGIGVGELLEKVLLEAELLELKANPKRKAVGSIIESSLDKGRGYVATVLVQNGTLRVGDIVLAGTFFGRVKAMFNERNQRITEAGPAEPALILGLNGAPTAGDTLNVMDTEQEAREIATKRIQLQRELSVKTARHRTLEDIVNIKKRGEFHELNIIVKGDVDGSIEAIQDSLIKLSTDEVQVNVIHKAVGQISESDVSLAAASDAIIIGFQVRPSQLARKAAEREGVQIRLYSVIYQAIEDVKDAMEGMLEPEIKEDVLGTAEVLQTFHISKVGTIAGAIVREGKIKRSSKVRVIRDGIVIHTGDLGSLKRMKDDVKEVTTGYECGLNLATFNDVQVGDIIECYETVEIKKTLE
ncbi:MAG: translation initiation factor IF-2 [Muribaculaceae bacterium]|nr:translation initiation factor IF-2 [Muribaculaceae bacterium]